MWIVRGSLPSLARSILIPDGNLVVMFNLGDPQHLCDRRDALRSSPFHASWVSGLQPAPLVLQQAGRYHVVGIQFKVAGAFSLFREPLSELTGQVVELETLWGGEARRVRDALADAPDDAARLVCLESWLSRALREAPPPLLVAAAAALSRGGSVAGTAAALGVSRKHLHAAFTRRIGLPPRLYGRVQRLQRTIARIGHTVQVDWADAAAQGGYYDQSHLIHEFGELVGLTPAEYLARRSPHLGYLRHA